MNTLLLFCAPIDTVLRVVDVVLGALPGVIDGPVVRSVLSSSLDTADAIVAQSGGRVRMETDQHHGFSGGWALPRSGKAGRWVVVFPDVGEGLLNMSELFGPPSGGPPPVDDPLWQAVCGGRRPTDLHVVSLGRIERKVWVAHDGDGQVFAEVVFDHSRSLGTHEVLSELIVRFDMASTDVRERIAMVLSGDARSDGPDETDGPDEMDGPDVPDSTVGLRARARAVDWLVGLAGRFDKVRHVELGRRSRRELVSDIGRFVDLVKVLDAGGFGAEWLPPVVHDRIAEVAHQGERLLQCEAWVTLAAEFGSHEFEIWAKKERRRVVDLFASELRSLVLDGVSADIRLVAELVVQVPPSAFGEALTLEASNGRNVLLSGAREWKQRGYRLAENLPTSLSMAARRVAMTFELLGVDDGETVQIQRSLHRLCAYDTQMRLLKERLFETHPSLDVVYDAAQAIERDTSTHHKLVKRATRDLDHFRHRHSVSLDSKLG